MSVLGRDAEISQVLALRGGVLVVTGEPGAGKSTLLDVAADSAGTRVLRVGGAGGEADLPFAGLHQLLRPVLDEVATLPERQRDALLRAVGLDDGPPSQEPARRLLVGVALLTLLSDSPRCCWWSTTCSGWTRAPARRSPSPPGGSGTSRSPCWPRRATRRRSPTSRRCRSRR